MTIKHSPVTRSMIAQCDECLDVIDFEPGVDYDEDDVAEAFRDIKAAIDQDGWRTRRMPDGSWRNICPDCL